MIHDAKGMVRIPGFLLLLAAGIWQAQGSDPFLGNWVLDPSRSEIRAGLRVTIELRDKALRYSSGGVQFTALFDGDEYPLRGLSARVGVVLSRVDSRTIKRVYRRDGVPVSEATMTVTPDGRFLTVSNRRLDPEGKGRTSTSTYQRVESGHASDPFAGTWDRNPVRLMGNSPSGIAFEPFGNSGLHFIGDFLEYIAEADGREYKALGTIVADTISLTRIDRRTLEEVWKDGSKVAATVKRVISTDGSELTATVSGVTPQGDHFENVFVYRRSAP